MKKLILFLLTATLLILPLSGCFADNQQNEGTTPNNTTENTTPDATTPENTEPDYNPGPDETTPPENNQENPPVVNGGELLDKTSDLAVTLIDYLEEYWYQVEPAPLVLASQINEIKNGTKPLLAIFDSSDYYYVCGYYTSPHELEYLNYCCPEEYTWVKYEDESQIQECYNEMKCVVAFQIDIASNVTNILDGTNTFGVEHFQIYKPSFENGVNINPSVTFDQMFVYLHRSDKEVAYHCTSTYYNHLVTMPCIYLKGEYYFYFYLYQVYPNGERGPDRDYTESFREYHDVLMNLMEEDKYSTTHESGYVTSYGIISFEDFVNGVLK